MPRPFAFVGTATIGAGAASINPHEQSLLIGKTDQEA